MSYHTLRQRWPPSRETGLWTAKNKPGPCGPGSGGGLAKAAGKVSGNGPDAGAHQADAVEIGLFPGTLFSPLAGLVALVQ